MTRHNPDDGWCFRFGCSIKANMCDATVIISISKQTAYTYLWCLMLCLTCQQTGTEKKECIIPVPLLCEYENKYKRATGAWPRRAHTRKRYTRTYSTIRMSVVQFAVKQNMLVLMDATHYLMSFFFFVCVRFLCGIVSSKQNRFFYW